MPRPDGKGAKFEPGAAWDALGIEDAAARDLGGRFVARPLVIEVGEKLRGLQPPEESAGGVGREAGGRDRGEVSSRTMDFEVHTDPTAAPKQCDQRAAAGVRDAEGKIGRAHYAEPSVRVARELRTRR